MKTTHKIIYEDSRKMNDLQDKSIDLMITSPPYPMIEMWDKMFSEQNQTIKNAIKKENGNLAFELMHKELDKVWKEIYRVLKIGGIACINIGDATRKINGEFKLYSNHSRILSYCISLGFSALPTILWRKQTNAPNKFMGSGMLPVGAYVTLEHEYILILRKGNKKEFKTEEDKEKRQQSAFFWEERNVWFSDIWDNLKGIGQKLNYINLRERSGAFPFELAYRLINMFSVQGDIVLDPFLGTGTTTLACLCSKRSSIGYEIEQNFKDIINVRIKEMISCSKQYNLDRLNRHLIFVKEIEEKRGQPLPYTCKPYGFKVMTKQEQNLILYHIDNIKEKDDSFEAYHEETKYNPMGSHVKEDLTHYS